MAELLRIILFALLTYPLVFLCAFPVLFYLHKAFGRPFGLRRVIILFALGLSIYGPLLLTNLPLPKDFAAFCATTGQDMAVRLKPFQFIPPAKYFLAVLIREGQVLRIPFLIESFLNFWMLFPAGALFRLLKKRHWLFPVSLGLLSSLFLELTQLTGLWGFIGCAHRVFDVDDIILNASGFVCGWIALSMVMYLVSLRSSRDA